MWLVLLGLLSFLMVSTWRYWSFKELNLLRPRTPLILVVMGVIIYAILNWSQPVLVILASIYVGSGIAIRLGASCGAISGRRRNRIRRHRLAETIALVGGETLLGREVREVLAETALGQQLRLVAGDGRGNGHADGDRRRAGVSREAGRGRGGRCGGGDSGGVAGIFEGGAEANPGGLIIDLTYAAEDDPAARFALRRRRARSTRTVTRVRKSSRIRRRWRLRWC